MYKIILPKVQKITVNKFDVNKVADLYSKTTCKYM